MLQNITIHSIPPEKIDLIRPLWEGLRDHHAEHSQYFKTRYHKMSFDQRKMTLLEKTEKGKLRIDVVEDSSKNQLIAYCISSVCKEISGITGEIDSIFIDKTYRKKGIGTKLMDIALKWLDSEKVDTKKIIIAHGNEEAFEFYKRYGFYHLHNILQQKNE
jgi:diamine N-acetyltransferase